MEAVQLSAQGNFLSVFYLLPLIQIKFYWLDSRVMMHIWHPIVNASGSIGLAATDDIERSEGKSLLNMKHNGISKAKTVDGWLQHN